jgi:GT2 family glycosyltransferase
MKPAPTLSASLVLYRNQPDSFEQAIRSFLEGCDDGQLFVIDNSQSPIRSLLFEHPRVVYRFIGRNVGFGAGHNLALKYIESAGAAPPDLHLFLNPDVAFGPDALPTLLAEMVADSSIGALMPRIVFPDGELQRLCKLLPTPADLLLRRFLPLPPLVNALNRRYELHGLPLTGKVEVPSLSGCFLLVRRSVLREVGGFDERFFMYMEDVDLVRRIGDCARIIYLPSVSVTHGYAKGSYRDRRLLRYHLRSARLYFDKWGWWFDRTRHERNKRTLEALQEDQRVGADS